MEIKWRHITSISSISTWHLFRQHHYTSIPIENNYHQKLKGLGIPKCGLQLLHLKNWRMYWEIWPHSNLLNNYIFVQMFDISVNIKDPKKADNILKSSWEVQSFQYIIYHFSTIRNPRRFQLVFHKKAEKKKKVFLPLFLRHRPEHFWLNYKAHARKNVKRWPALQRQPECRVQSVYSSATSRQLFPVDSSPSQQSEIKNTFF